MNVPGRIDVRRAVRTYVLGHDARVDPTAKEELAQSSLEGETAPSPEPEGTSASLPASRFGVPVPERLAFHRSASRWRERIPGLRSGRE